MAEMLLLLTFFIINRANLHAKNVKLPGQIITEINTIDVTLRNKDFLGSLAEYFKDCTELARKIRDKELKGDGIIEIVEFYKYHCSGLLQFVLLVEPYRLDPFVKEAKTNLSRSRSLTY